MKTHIDLLALGVALLALGATVWQGNAQIKHNHVSVQPRMTSYFSNNGNDNKWGIYAVNNGMGTGFVESLEVFVDSKPMPDHLYGKFFSAVTALKLNPMCFLIGGPRPNDSFQVGSEERLIEANPAVSKECALDKLALQTSSAGRLDYEVVIKSIYGDRFRYRFSTNTQTEI